MRRCVPFLAGLLTLCAPLSHARGDIYRFVTIDGVETFTDAPVNKDARVILKEGKAQKQRPRKGAKKEVVHEISLEEVAEKAARAYQNATTAPTGGIEPKLPQVGGYITSGVGMRVDPIDGKLRHHNGIDIAIPEGTPVRPVGPGIVVFSGQRPGYGHTILVEHDNGMVSLYGHNSRLAASQGERVDTSTVIALSGNTGRSTGPHLHFEAWQSGVNVTPAFLPGSAMKLPDIQLAARHSGSHFRKEILADGTVLFTNLPSVSRP